MGLMITGLLIWSLVHFIPSIAQPIKTGIISAKGEKTYKLIFTVLMLAALAMIIFGWRSATPEFLYQAPVALAHVAKLLVVIAFILFGASNYPTRIKNIIRHPQLSGVALWAVAHLVLNGDSRSVWLFGCLAVWAILEMLLINRREGPWVKIEPPSWGREIRGLVISIIIVVVVVKIHPYIAGVPII